MGTVRTALRALGRKRGVTALAIVSVGLAIGFSTAAFSILDAYELRDLPVDDPGHLASVSIQTPEQRTEGANWPEYVALASRVHSFAGLLAEDRQSPKVSLADRDDFPITAGVSDNYFDLLGVRAAMGDVFHAGRGQDESVVITHRYWQSLLNGDPAVIGRTLRVGRAALRIIGVLTPDFTGTNRGLLVDLFVPSQTFFGALGRSDAHDVRDISYELTARLRPDVTVVQAQAECDAVLRQSSIEGLAPGPERRSSVLPIASSSVLQKLESNGLMLGIVVLLVWIAASNFASLRLLDSADRRRDTAIRLALGAGPWALFRQHWLETLVQIGCAAALGLLVAQFMIHAAPALLYAGQEYTDYNIRLDARTLGFSAASLLSVALIGSLIPFSATWRQREGLTPSGAGVTRTSRWMATLVVAQMATVTGVTCSTGLLWQTLENLSAIRPAMDPNAQVLLVQGSFSGAGVDPAARAEALTRGLIALPGVEHVAWARRAMLSGSGGGAVVDLDVPGQPRQSFPYNAVSPTYFATTGARLLNGRVFSEADGVTSTPVVLVNSAYLRHAGTTGNPLGTWITVAGRTRQVIGVVEDGPQNHLLEENQPYFYFPFAQMPSLSVTYFIAARRDPGALADGSRTYIGSADNAFTIRSMVTMRQHMRGARGNQQAAAEIAGALAALGLLLAAAGLFGVTQSAVAARTREFGVRIAVGASGGQLARHVLVEVAGRIAVAIPVGWLLAYSSRSVIAKMLYGITPDDPRMFIDAAIVIAVVACAATTLPALRAARVDPITALRPE